MRLSNESALVASLLGSKAVEQLPRFAAVQNEIAKHVIPTVNFLPIASNEFAIATESDLQNVEQWMNDRSKSVENQFFPFSFRSSKDENWWTLPWEPLINIESNVRLTERYIAKSGKNLIGSIKERWSLDDYNITITGAFYGAKMRGSVAETYPRYEMEKLRDYLLTPEAIEVLCEPLQILGINKISILSVNFPFTKGESVQAYEIRAKSDFPWELIYKRTKPIVGNITGERA